MSCEANASAAVPRRRGWFARLALLLGGVLILLVSTGLVLLLAVGAAADEWSSFQAWAGMLALAPCVGGGLWCIIQAVRGRAPGTGPAAPPRQREVSLRGLVVTIAVATGLSLTLFALGVRDAGGFERLLLHHPMHLAVAAWYALLFLVLLPLVVTIHELGHLAAGALLRLRFAFVQVGPIALARKDGRLTFRCNRPIPDDVLGLQSSIPDGDDALVWRLLLHSAGGPALNLLTAALAWVAIGAAAPTSAAHAALLDACKVAGFVSALAGICNLFPFRTRRGRLSDGGRILHVLGARTGAGLMLLRVGVRYARAQRPRDWNLDSRELVRLSDADSKHRDALLLFALATALDQGDRSLAREILVRAESIAGSADPARTEFALQAVLFDVLDGQAVLARQRLERLEPHLTDPERAALAEAAVLVSEGRTAEAGEALLRWDRAMAARGSTVRIGNEWAEDGVRERLAQLAGEAAVTV